MAFDWATVTSVAGVLFAGLAILNRRMDRRFDAVDRRFELVDRKFESIDRTFDHRFEIVEQQLRTMAQDIGNLRQDAGRLQGLVERAYEPERLARTSVQVREQHPAYGDAPPVSGGPGGEEPES